jgi:hypothetical protein
MTALLITGTILFGIIAAYSLRAGEFFFALFFAAFAWAMMFGAL